ncbi:hypothetical protein SAMN05414139_10893 [Burkholderia sp. D7]|nr:hypothetical protein SAMN05414139_10893 [Burkholderia sp. D7]
MSQTYQYHGFEIAVAVENDLSRKDASGAPACVGCLSIVTISRIGAAIAVFSPLRFGESQGKSFTPENDALMSGYSAGRRVVDDLLTS